MEIDYISSHLYTTTFHDPINYWYINSSPVFFFVPMLLHIDCTFSLLYILHLSHSLSHCRDATGNKTCSVRWSRNTPNIKWTFILYAYNSILNNLYGDDFIFWKWQVIIKPNTESLCGMIQFSVVKIKWPWSQENTTVNGHIFRGIGSESIFILGMLDAWCKLHVV